MTPERPLFSGNHRLDRRKVLLGLGLGPVGLVAERTLRRLQKPLEVLAKTPEPEVSLLVGARDVKIRSRIQKRAPKH